MVLLFWSLATRTSSGLLSLVGVCGAAAQPATQNRHNVRQQRLHLLAMRPPLRCFTKCASSPLHRLRFANDWLGIVVVVPDERKTDPVHEFPMSHKSTTILHFTPDSEGDFMRILCSSVVAAMVLVGCCTPALGHREGGSRS